MGHARGQFVESTAENFDALLLSLFGAMPSPVIQLPTTTRYALGYPTYRDIGRCQILKVLKTATILKYGGGVGMKRSQILDMMLAMHCLYKTLSIYLCI